VKLEWLPTIGLDFDLFGIEDSGIPEVHQKR